MSIEKIAAAAFLFTLGLIVIGSDIVLAVYYPEQEAAYAAAEERQFDLPD
jgi:hypothetical protein